MAESPLVSIIILNWNGLADTLECLKSVYELLYPRVEVVLVDNGSTDGSVDKIPQLYSGIHLLKNAQNLGFAEGNNVGMRYAFDKGADYCWLLNNDTLVDKLALEHLVRVAETSDQIGMVGSKIYFCDKDKTLLWYAGGTIDWRRGSTHHVGWGEVDVGQYDAVREVQSLTGCSMLVKKSVYQEIGLMDERFFLYAEETEWCVRAQRSGFTCMFAPLSMVYHKVGASTKENWSAVFSYYNTRNMLQTVRKNFFFPWTGIYVLTIVASKIWSVRREIARFLLRNFARTRKYPYNLSALQGIIDFFRGKMGKVDLENLPTSK